MSESGKGSLDDSVGFNLNRVARLYRRELTRALAAYHLSPEQWQILAALSSGGDSLTQAEIASLTLKDRHSMSRMLDRMEEADWVTRTPHPEDGRAAAVRLGKRCAELGRIRALLRAHFSRINSALTEAQQKQLLSLLKTLRAHLGD